MRGHGYLVVVGVILVLTLTGGAVGASAGPWEGFESGIGGWRASDASWTDTNATGVFISDELATEGRYSLRLDFAGDATKACAYLDQDMDLRALRAVTLDLYNGTSAGQVAIAVCTGDAWEWQESMVIDVKPGWNKGLTFDMTAWNWKSAATDWAFTGKLRDLERTRRFVVLFYERAEKQGSVYIDNIQFVTAEAEAEAEAATGGAGLSISGTVTAKVTHTDTDPNEWAIKDPIENGGGYKAENGWSWPPEATGAVEASSDWVAAGEDSVKFINSGTVDGYLNFQVDFSGSADNMNWTEDWTQYSGFSFDVYNPTSRTYTVHIYIRNNWTGDDAHRFDADIEPGEQVVAFDFPDPSTCPRDDVRAIWIKVDNMVAGDALYFDKFQLKSAQAVPSSETVYGLRLDLTAATPSGLKANAVVDVEYQDGDPSVELARGSLWLGPLRLFYHDRFTNADDLMKLFWQDPDNEDLDIEDITWEGVEVVGSFGKAHLDILYLPGGPSVKESQPGYDLTGLRVTYSLGGPTLGLTGAWGKGNVVGVDATVPLGFATLVAEAAMADGSAGNWGVGAVLKDGALGPFGYYLEFMRTTPGFLTPDSDWSKENCSKFYGKVTVAPFSGLTLTGVHDYFHKLDGTWDKVVRSVNAELTLLPPFKFIGYYEITNSTSGDGTKFEGTAEVTTDRLSLSALIRSLDSTKIEKEFAGSVKIGRNSSVTGSAEYLTGSTTYDLGFKTRLTELLDLTFDYEKYSDPTVARDTYSVALVHTF